MTSGGPNIERVIAEAYIKAAEVVLDARIVGSSKRGLPQPQKRAWFNLEVPEVEPAATTALERWRREAGLPLVLELARLSPSTVYKRLVITLRSLYTYLRLLPAYRMYRACKRQRGANFTLGYRLHSTLPGRAAGASSARRLQSFRFGGVDTPYGQFRISVDYQPASTVTILEQTTSPPPLPQIIADYLGASGGGEGGAPLRHAIAAAPPMLEYPAASMGGGGDEADVLPFALDEGAPSPIKPRSPAPGAASDAAEQLPISAAPGTAPSARVAGAAAPAPAVDTDAAVGAFVRLIQEAPPLRLHSSGPPTRPGSADFAAGRAGAAAPGTSSGSDSSGATCLSDGRGLTLQAGLRQFSRIKERLRQKGIPVGPCPAEA
ncbi:hypothetical protein COHA_009462 [Chlorella ohadii]|uniref:Autophagy-related protein 13 N-terminal domain-containing protein n=1 Tax=Chlorella ohadii TaxID=2649997 RepID=A0AAD5DIA2_9CHLO|nr:hypothetical protein COHA_009462 [Chlorella ohadii]